jgi:hypothetical protein
MKTLETILNDKSDSSSNDEREQLVQSVCAHCGAKEGEKHPFRGFEVILQPVEKYNSNSPKVCAICRLEHLKKEARNMNKIESTQDKIKKYGLLPVFIILLTLLMTGLIYAQPPGLPGAPDQAPIDGGLSLLAAAGGAYAIKKLRNKNREEDVE